MIYLTLKDAVLLMISVSVLTLMVNHVIMNRKQKFTRCTFIKADQK